MCRILVLLRTSSSFGYLKGVITVVFTTQMSCLDETTKITLGTS